jgi:hypothetical protein
MRVLYILTASLALFTFSVSAADPPRFGNGPSTAGFVRARTTAKKPKTPSLIVVTVLGAVKEPGIYSLSSMRLVDAIALAGGLKLPSTKNVIVKRGNAKGVKSTKVDLESILTGDAQFFQLASGDLVYVKEQLF